MKTGLQLAGVVIEADQAHPNKLRFRGVLVRLDEASTKPPNGAQGHRILVPTEVAKRRLKTLIGMGLNYAPDLDAHAQRRKVGVINKAWIDGKELRVEGHVWKHDFPEAVKDLKQPDLGMSMELGDVQVDNPNADVWKLDDFQFLGATILWRDSAAYNRTRAIAARAEQRRASMKRATGKTRSAARASQSDRLVQIAAEAATSAVKKSSKQVLAVLETQTKALAGISAAQEELDARIAALESAGTSGGSEDEDEVNAAGNASSSSSSTSSEEQIAGAGKASSSSSTSSEDEVDARSSSTSSDEDDGDGEDDDDIDSEVDKGDLEEDEESEGNAGHANEDADNRGHDGAGDLAKKVGKTVESARVKALKAENDKLRKRLKALKASSTKANGKLTSKLSRLEKQVSAATEKMGRKSISPEVTAMLAKANIDPADLLRTGTKMSVAEVDAMIRASGITMNSVDSMALKNVMLAAGVMETGQVERNHR